MAVEGTDQGLYFFYFSYMTSLTEVLCALFMGNVSRGFRTFVFLIKEKKS